MKVWDVPRDIKWSTHYVPGIPTASILKDGESLHTPIYSFEGPSVIKLQSGAELNVIPILWIYTQNEAILHLKQSPDVVLQTDSHPKSVEFSVLNFTQDLQLGKCALDAHPWEITIRAVPSLYKLKTALRDNGGYAITHSGVIERRDGKTFAVEEVSDLLYALDDFLSFVCGSYCALTNVVGIDSGGVEAWKRWGAYHISPWRRQRSWFDVAVSGELSKIFSVFWHKYNENKRGLSRILKLYAHSSESSSTDVSVILTQTALEALAYMTVGEQAGRKAGEWVADSLKKAGIHTQIPPNFKELIELQRRNKWVHGPHTIVGIRNSMIHTKSIDGDISLRAYYEARELGLWYLELMLLRKFKYTGEYSSRRTLVQVTGGTELVPWAQGAGDAHP